jgi:hypothetical protein
LSALVSVKLRIGKEETLVKKMLKLKMISVLAALLLLLLAVTVAYAQGHTPDQLANAGRTCVPAGPNLWIHCFPSTVDFPDDLINGVPKTVQVQVFGEVPPEEGLQFLGTELLIHEDLFLKGKGNQQPCPQDPHEDGGKGTYHYLGDEPPFFPYYACHHYDRPQ